MNIEQKLTHQAFLNREQSISHLAYERENAFFKAIQDGDVQEMRRLYQPFEISEMGKLSEEPLRNLQYHLIITVALITRACIEGGMEMEEAYNLSDIYIHSIDRCKEAEEVRIEVTGCEPETVSGDSVTDFEADGRYYMILSDGMGSGKEAALMSGMAASILER